MIKYLQFQIIHGNFVQKFAKKINVAWSDKHCDFE